MVNVILNFIVYGFSSRLFYILSFILYTFGVLKRLSLISWYIYLSIRYKYLLFYR